MAEYKVRDPSGNIRVISGPDGASDADVIAQAKRLFADEFVRSKPGPAQPSAAQQIANDPMTKEAEQIAGTSPAEAIAGYGPVRFAMGAAAPVIGAAQLIQNLPSIPGPLAAAKVLTAPFSNEKVQQLEQMKQRGMAVTGDQGTDFAGMAGTVLSPASLATMKIPPAASALGRIGQGGAIGAGFGATTPVTNDGDFWGQKAAQTGTGAALGLAIPGVVELGSALARGGRNLVDPWLPDGAKRVAGRSAVTAAEKGDKLKPVIEALRKTKPDVPNAQLTAGEAAAPVGSTEFSALQEVVRPRQPTAYDELAKAQNAARLAAVRTVGGDANALRTAKDLRAATAELNYGPIMPTRIDPTPPEEVLAARLAGKEASKASALQDQGRFATQAAQQENLARGGTVNLAPRQTAFDPFNVGARTAGGGTARSPSSFPVEGMPRVPGRYTENIQRVPENRAAAADLASIVRQREAERKFIDYQLQSLLQDAGRESPNMRTLLERPSVRAAFEDAAKSARESGAYFPSKPGDPFSIANLQRMKESMDSGIRAAKASESAGNRPDLSPGELTKTKQAFTAWLEKRSPAWAKARNEYKRDSEPINQMEIGQYIESKLVPALADIGRDGPQRAAVFAQAMRDAPGTIKRATGEQRYQDIAEALTYPQMQALEGVGRSLGRTSEHERLARLGMDTARRIAGEVTPTMKSPGILSHAVTIPRAIINRLEGKVQGKAAEELATLMRNPNALADEMERAIRQREAIARVLSMPMQYGTRGAIIGATGGMNQ